MDCGTLYKISSAFFRMALTNSSSCSIVRTQCPYAWLNIRVILAQNKGFSITITTIHCIAFLIFFLWVLLIKMLNKIKNANRSERTSWNCRFLSNGWPTLPSAALVLRVYSAASTPTQPIPHCNYCTHAISEGVPTSSQNRSSPELKSMYSQNKSCWFWYLSLLTEWQYLILSD